MDREVLEFCPYCGFGGDMKSWRDNSYQCRCCGRQNHLLKEEDESDPGNVVNYDDVDMLDEEAGEDDA